MFFSYSTHFRIGDFGFVYLHFLISLLCPGLHGRSLFRLITQIVLTLYPVKMAYFSFSLILIPWQTDVAYCLKIGSFWHPSDDPCLGISRSLKNRTIPSPSTTPKLMTRKIFLRPYVKNRDTRSKRPPFFRLVINVAHS